MNEDINKIKRIYLDHAATTPVRSEVLDRMMDYFSNNFGNPSSIYASGVRAKRDLEKFRKEIASSINAEPERYSLFPAGLRRIIGRSKEPQKQICPKVSILSLQLLNIMPF